jgi:hypothetical protein
MPPVADTGDREPPVRMRTLAWVTAVGAVIGLSFGTVETVLAIQRQSDFNGHKTPSSSGKPVEDCNTMFLSDACRPLKQSYERAVTGAIIGYAAGGALAIGSAVLFGLSSRERRVSTAALACTPSFPLRGVSCGLTF